jgi:hypothetical protein
MNLLTDNWICLSNGTKTNINDVLDKPVSEIFSGVLGYSSAIIVFALLKSYLKEVNEADFIDFLQTPANQFKSDKLVPIDQIVYNQPRASTIKRNRDHFIKRGGVKCLCEGCATQSLLVTALFGGPCGAGYFPSLYSSRLLAFKSGNTLREILDNNRIKEKYDFKQLFSSPYKICFTEKKFGECSLCGEETGCYSEFMRESAGDFECVDNLPLIVRNRSGKVFVYSSALTPIQKLSRINNGDILLPSNTDNVNINDKIHFFSIIYNKSQIMDIDDTDITYSSVNIVRDIDFLTNLILSFHVADRETLQYNIATLFSSLLNIYDINQAAIKIFEKFMPDDTSRLRGEKFQALAVAANKIQQKYGNSY